MGTAKARSRRPAKTASSPARRAAKQRLTKRWERRSDERPAELVAAALRLFSERGFAATRLEDVALAAGVTKGTVYLYFGGKEELFAAVASAAVAPRVEQIEALVDSFDGTTEALLRTLFRGLEAAIEGPLPSIVKLVIAESGNFPQLARTWSEIATDRLFRLVERLITRGVERGELRPVPAEVVAPLMMAPVLFLALWKRTLEPHGRRVIEPAAVLRAHLEILMHGLGLPASSPRTRRSRP